ncbi:GspE/PulE family protein [Clostridium tertium]|uniref:GspE/PulE family protein n=1 Tax=Clostridium tertium TaxID=1559 RepID=UPI0023B22033|nr:ATPase, T2SS/T4P/T4SS family [Clostridium tertium]
MNKIRLGEYLISKQYITEDELNDALAKQQNITNIQSRQLGNILLSLGIMTENEMTEALNEHSGGVTNYRPILSISITDEITKEFPISTFKNLDMIPLNFDNKTSTLELGTILDSTASIELALTSLRDIYPRVKLKVSRVLEHSYAIFFNEYSKMCNADLKMPSIQVNANEKLRQIFRDAIELSASDIHIFGVSSGVRIQFRVARDLIMYDRVTIPLSMKQEIDRCMTVLCNLPTSVLAQGQIDTTADELLGDGKWKGRVNLQNTVRGFSITMRLIPKFDAIKGFNSLNFTEPPRKYMEELIKARSGLILVTGPMGSGKNNTITGMVVELNDSTRYITTIEDPVEMYIDGVNQVSIDSKTTSFGQFGRSILRQDCDVLYLGEIRDIPSLDTAIQGGLEGMIVMSTLHTKSVGEIFSRIDSIDKTAYKKAVAALTGIINQRLIRKLCPNCKKEIKFEDLDDREKMVTLVALQKITGSKVKYAGKLYKAAEEGCPHCKGRGYKGAVVCIEFLNLTPALRTRLARCTDTVQAEEIVREATIKDKTSIEYDGINRLQQGVVDIASLISEGVFSM